MAPRDIPQIRFPGNKLCDRDLGAEQSGEHSWEQDSSKRRESRYGQVGELNCAIAVTKALADSIKSSGVGMPFWIVPVKARESDFPILNSSNLWMQGVPGEGARLDKAASFFQSWLQSKYSYESSAANILLVSKREAGHSTTAYILQDSQMF